MGHGCPVQHKDDIGCWHVIKCAPKEADTKILNLQWKKNSSRACLLWVFSAPESCTIMVHSFTNFSPELYKFLLPLSFILCVFLPKREHKRIWCSQSQTLCDNITAGWANTTEPSVNFGQKCSCRECLHCFNVRVKNIEHIWRWMLLWKTRNSARTEKWTVWLEFKSRLL